MEPKRLPKERKESSLSKDERKWADLAARIDSRLPTWEDVQVIVNRLLPTIVLILAAATFTATLVLVGLFVCGKGDEVEVESQIVAQGSPQAVPVPQQTQWLLHDGTNYYSY